MLGPVRECPGHRRQCRPAPLPSWLESRRVWPPPRAGPQPVGGWCAHRSGSAAGQVQAGRGGDTEDGGEPAPGGGPCWLGGRNPLPAAKRRAAKPTAPSRSSPEILQCRPADPPRRASESKRTYLRGSARFSGGSPVHRPPSASASQPEDPWSRKFLSRPGGGPLGAYVAEHVGRGAVRGSVAGRRDDDHGPVDRARPAPPGGGLGPQPETGHAE